jgi:hypothetical protein
VNIFFSETAGPNKANFYRKHIRKVLYKIPHFIPVGRKTWLPWAVLDSEWLKFEKIFSSET